MNSQSSEKTTVFRDYHSKLCYVSKPRLWDAIEKDDLNQVHTLCEQNKEIVHIYWQRDTPFTYAADTGKWHIAEYFLEQGVSPDQEGAFGLPLYYAIEECNPKAVELLQKFNVNVNIHNGCNEGPLHWIMPCKLFSANQVAIVKMLLPHIQNINIQNADGNTPLHKAVTKYNNDDKGEQSRQNRKRIVNLLLFHGANPYIKNTKGNTAFEVAWSESQFNLYIDLKTGRQKLIAFLSNLLQSCGFTKDIAQYIAQIRYTH